MERVEFSIVNDQERRRIIEEALALLADTGIIVADERIRRAMGQAGAKVDASDQVRLPKELTKELLAMVPPSHDCETIAGERISLGGGGQLVTSIVLDPVVLDYTDGSRSPRISDVTLHTRLGDALPLINSTYKMDQRLEGMTPLESNVRSLCEFLSNTICYVVAAPSDKTSLKIWIEMLEVVLDGATFKERPIAGFAGHVKTPLQLSKLECELIAEATSRDIPLSVGACPMAGATSPFTLAGTLMLTIAETMFMAAAVEVCKPSHPLRASSSLLGFNMRSGDVSAGGVETFLLEAAFVELIKELGIPVGISCTFNEPARIDFQCGLETATKMLSSLLPNPDILAGLGSIRNAEGVSAEKILLDHDMLEMARRFQQGIRVEDDTLAAAAIREVGAGGNFMSSEHTLAHLRTGEHYYGGLFVREGQSGQTMLARAHQRVEEISRTHEPNVPGERQEALRRAAERLQARYGNT